MLKLRNNGFIKEWVNPLLYFVLFFVLLEDLYMDAFAGLDLAPDLTLFKQNTNTAMQRVREDNLTPFSITQSRMGDGIAKKTASDTGVTGTITEYRDSVVDVLDGVVGAMSGGLLNTKDLTKAIKVGRDGITFSTDNILAAASKQLGYPVSGESGAMRKIASDISKEFSRITGLNIGQLITSDGSTFRTNRNWRGQLGGETLRMLGRMTGLDQFLDRSVTGSLYNSMYYNAAQYGMKDGYRGIWRSYPKGFESLRRDATLEALRYMITNGDIESLDEVLKILKEEDAEHFGNNLRMVKSKYPNFIEILFSNFRFDDGVFPEDYDVLRAKLLSVLERIMGPNWWMTYTEFGPALNLVIVSKASKDMIKLLQGYDPIAPLLCTAGKFQESSCLLELRNQFKGAPQFPR